MATAPTVRSSRAKLHVRGTWSAREDRVPSAVWLGILCVGIIAGFGMDIPRYMHENPPASWVVHVHAAVFTIWLLLLAAQVLLVLRDRVAWHRRLGWFAAGWACLMAVMGPWAAMASKVPHLHDDPSGPPFLSVNLLDIAGFLILLAWGIALRKNPAAHKRMMILATVSLADPGFSRISGYFLPEPTHVIPWFAEVFYGNVLLIVLMVAWDWWRGRLIRSFVMGAAALLLTEYGATLLYFWGPWRTLSTAWVEAWARHFS
ncbi:hypothetical protein [Acidicapsa ligni]|uniref:hypothetical protein n=1 Tax=Acidicapsa ligni TaxID=542300 RepID=UPI0021E07E7B|nr:hypothetical protein [Acidicapsa ligni]